MGIKLIKAGVEVRVREWLCPINPEDEQRAFQEARAVGTGNWILQYQTYEVWITSPGSILWISGQSETSLRYSVNE